MGMPYKRLALALAIALTALAVGIAGLELYLRYTAPKIVENDASSLGRFAQGNPDLLIRHTPRGRRLIPNADVVIRNHNLSGRDIIMKINSMGFRDDEIAEDKQEDEIRLLILGDSITWGDYLQAEETYVEQLERALSESYPTHTVEAINAGVGDIGISEEIDILTELGLSVQPDIVIVSFYLNDSRPPWGFPGELGHRGFFRRHSLLVETLHRNLTLRRWVKERGEERFTWMRQAGSLNWHGDRQEFLKLANLARYDWGAAWEEDSWEIVDDRFVALKALADEHDFEVVVVAFPVSFQVYADFLETYPQDRLRELADGHGFGFVDLLPVLRQHTDKKLFFDQCHPGTGANRVIGHEIANYLRREYMPAMTSKDGSM
jgi:lysophospholipase L1-like esterase